MAQSLVSFILHWHSTHFAIVCIIEFIEDVNFSITYFMYMPKLDIKFFGLYYNLM